MAPRRFVRVAVVVMGPTYADAAARLAALEAQRVRRALVGSYWLQVIELPKVESLH